MSIFHFTVKNRVNSDKSVEGVGCTLSWLLL